MRCPDCDSANPRDAVRCGTCDRPLARRGRRRGPPDESDTPFNPTAEGLNREAQRAYRLAVLGLVPGLGLVLGPLGALRGAAAGVRGKDDPGFTAAGPARAAVLLGGLAGLTNWVGVTLMVLGLRAG